MRLRPLRWTKRLVEDARAIAPRLRALVGAVFARLGSIVRRAVASSRLLGARLLLAMRVWGTTLVGIAVVLALLAAADQAAERTASLDRADPRLKRAIAEQRMWTERISQTALRLAEAEPEERQQVAGELEDAVAHWSLNHAAFRSVGAAAGAPPGLAVMRVSEWAELDRLQQDLQRAAFGLVSDVRAVPDAPPPGANRVRGVTQRASWFQDLTARWVGALEHVQDGQRERDRRVRRVCLGAAAGSLALLWAGPRRRSLRDVRARLAERERRHRLLVERCPNGVIVVAGGQVRFANPAARALFGVRRESELLGVGVLDLFAPEDRPELGTLLAAAARGEATGPREVHAYRPDGTPSSLLVHPAPLLFEGRRALEMILVDVTERRRDESRRQALEAGLRALERRESLALMAAGVAHDFENLLTTILLNAEIAQREAGAPGGAVDEIVQATRAASDLVGVLLTYAGEGEPAREDVELAGVVHEVFRLLLPRIPTRVLLRLDVSAGVPRVRGDRTELLRVVMNLVTNAIEAIGETAGRIDVRTRVARSEQEAPDAAGDGLPPGRCVVLEVEDTGAGMDEATLARVFDPFYSTKATGRGLGLAAVLGIVRRHGGAVRVESAPGRGSRFRVILPAPEATPDDEGGGPARG